MSGVPLDLLINIPLDVLESALLHRRSIEAFRDEPELQKVHISALEGLMASVGLAAADSELTYMAPPGYVYESHDGLFTLRPVGIDPSEDIVGLTVTPVSVVSVRVALESLNRCQKEQARSVLEALSVNPVILRPVMHQRPTAFECITEDHMDVYLSYERQGDAARAVALYSA